MQTLVGTEELVRAYSALIRDGQPAVIDGERLEDQVYAAEHTPSGDLELMLAGGGPSVYLVFDQRRHTASLLGVGFSERITRPDDEQRSLAVFADAYITATGA